MFRSLKIFPPSLRIQIFKIKSRAPIGNTATTMVRWWALIFTGHCSSLVSHALSESQFFKFVFDQYHYGCLFLCTRLSFSDELQVNSVEIMWFKLSYFHGIPSSWSVLLGIILAPWQWQISIYGFFKKKIKNIP